MKAEIKIRMDNDAFVTQGWPTELARILRDLATYIENEAPRKAGLRDLNGNHVGFFKVVGAKMTTPQD